MVGILILLNLTLLGLTFGKSFLFSPGQHRPPHPEGPKGLIIEKLHFDHAQKKAYEKLIHAHRTQIDSLDHEVRFCKNELYSLLKQETIDTSAQKKLVSKLGELQLHIEQTHFNHFADIKKLCRPNQMDDYDELTAELAALFSHPPKPPHD